MPRGAYTKMFDKFHIKLLASQAFRSPSQENFSLANQYEASNIDLKPEKTSVFEIEGGYLITRNLIVTANVFYNLIQDPILYFYDDDTDSEGYKNLDKVSTWGTEAEAKLKFDSWFASLNYSFYMPHFTVGDYEAPGDSGSLLGFPNHKLTLMASVLIKDHFRISPSLVFHGPKQAYDGIDEDEVEILHEQDPVALINLNLAYEDLFTDGLTVSAAVYNILDQRFVFAQPYNGWHSPMPGLGREILFRMAYELPF